MARPLRREFATATVAHCAPDRFCKLMHARHVRLADFASSSDAGNRAAHRKFSVARHNTSDRYDRRPGSGDRADRGSVPKCRCASNLRTSSRHRRVPRMASPSTRQHGVAQPARDCRSAARTARCRCRDAAARRLDAEVAISPVGSDSSGLLMQLGRAQHTLALEIADHRRAVGKAASRHRRSRNHRRCAALKRSRRLCGSSRSRCSRKRGRSEGRAA